MQQILKKTALGGLRFILARRRLYRLNRLLFHLSLHGMGIANYENSRVSGESYLMARLGRNQRKLIVLDIGANIGTFSVELRKTSPLATIYAFEPHKKTFQSLQTAAQEYGFEAINAGCGKTMGTASLFDYAGKKDGSEHATIYRDVIEQIHSATATSHEIEITTIDFFMTERKLPQIDFLKIDTEGNELNVLLGAERAIADGRVKAIQFEFNAMNVHSRTFFRDFYVLLAEYRLYRMLPDGFAPMGSYYPAAFEIFAFQNILALHTTCDLFACP